MPGQVVPVSCRQRVNDAAVMAGDIFLSFPGQSMMMCRPNLGHITESFRAVRSEIASFTVGVQAKDKAAWRFYERESFLPFPEGPLTLFRPIADIVKLLG
jgi:hypothetical protein